MSRRLLCLVLGALLDLLLGDPHWAPHPVRAIGNLIGGLEKTLRKCFPKTPWGELLAGGALVVLVLGVSTGTAALALALGYRIHPLLGMGLETLLCYQCLAARALRDESMTVCRALEAGDLPEARRAVSMIVGRDTEALDEAGVARAAVETVAENASDGVVAPLLYLALGGGALGIFYKAVNTMDSMVGYKNNRYLYFGRCAARLDDVMNFVPARLAGVLLCLAAPLAGLDGRGAWRIFCRDRRKHKSPNSAHTEAAAAGALGVRLAGPSVYFGQLVEKPFIGDDSRTIGAGDIRRVNRLMLAGAGAAVIMSALALGIIGV